MYQAVNVASSGRVLSDRSALLIAIDNENIEMIELLVSARVELGDALLHAIEEENVDAVELLLKAHQQQSGKKDLQVTRLLIHLSAHLCRHHHSHHPSLLHSFTPGSKPTFSANPSHLNTSSTLDCLMITGLDRTYHVLDLYLVRFLFIFFCLSRVVD